jgi:hypothetical protein
MIMKRSQISVFGTSILGLLLGGFVGFLLRPSSALVGKVSFINTLTRGATLEGVDQILINLAHKSFDIMLAGAIIGAVVGVVLAYIIKK